MKQIITIEIEEKDESTRHDYATIIMLALYDRRNKITENMTSENEEQCTKVAIELERLIKAVTHAKVKRV